MSPSSEQKMGSFAKIALLFGFGVSSSSPHSSRSFAAANGAVGLGIIAAMVVAGETDAAKPAVVALARTTEPIDIGAGPSPVAEGEKRRMPSVEEMALSETYTCVISYLGGQPAKKRVYYGGAGVEDMVGEFRGDGVVFFDRPPPPLPPPSRLAGPTFQVAGVQRRCFRCKRALEGLDIHMHVGDKAFYSVECRGHRMLLDELTKKYKTWTLRVSLFFFPLPSAAGVLMA